MAELRPLGRASVSLVNNYLRTDPFLTVGVLLDLRTDPFLTVGGLLDLRTRPFLTVGVPLERQLIIKLKIKLQHIHPGFAKKAKLPAFCVGRNYFR